MCPASVWTPTIALFPTRSACSALRSISTKAATAGQETVARVHTLGRPPRRLVRLQLDGAAEALPRPGAALLADDREVGFVGGSARHFELGPIALGLVKRTVPADRDLVVDGIAAAQEIARRSGSWAARASQAVRRR